MLLLITFDLSFSMLETHKISCVLLLFFSFDCCNVIMIVLVGEKTEWNPLQQQWKLSSACEAVMQTPSEEHVVFLLDAWSPQWTWRGRQRAIGTGAFDRYCTLGLFAHGGNAPSVSKASSMKEACIAVNRFMRHRFPNGTWTSIAVLLNPRLGLHRDCKTWSEN